MRHSALTDSRRVLVILLPFVPLKISLAYFFIPRSGRGLDISSGSDAYSYGCLALPIIRPSLQLLIIGPNFKRLDEIVHIGCMPQAELFMITAPEPQTLEALRQCTR